MDVSGLPSGSGRLGGPGAYNYHIWVRTPPGPRPSRLLCVSDPLCSSRFPGFRPIGPGALSSFFNLLASSRLMYIFANWSKPWNMFGGFRDRLSKNLPHLNPCVKALMRTSSDVIGISNRAVVKRHIAVRFCLRALVKWFRNSALSWS